MFKVKSEPKTDGSLIQTIATDSIDELYYMCDIKNLGSILQHGILSHHRVAKKVPGHTDISNSGVQDMRSRKRIERPEEDKKPMALHRHAPLYLNPHNGMMHYLTYKKGDTHKTLCVLRINKAILNRRNVTLTDKNAACSSASFFTPAAFTLESPLSDYLTLPYGYVHGEEPSKQEERKQARQAEALIPYEIQKEYICGIFVSSEAGKAAVNAELVRAAFACEITIHPSMFFQGPIGFPPRLAPFETLQPTMEHGCPPSPASSSSDDEGFEGYEPIPIKRLCSQGPRASISSPVRSAESEITTPLFFAKQAPCLETLLLPSSSSPVRSSEADADRALQETAATSSTGPGNDNEDARHKTIGGDGPAC